MMFVRFVVGVESENAYLLTGIFTIARELRDQGKLEPYEVTWLEEIFAWFNTHLPKPPFQANLSTGKWTPDAVAWFRDDAKMFIERMWDVTALLREKGVSVRFVQSENPGARGLLR